MSDSQSQDQPQVAENTSQKPYKEQPVIEKQVSTEVTPESQEKDIELPDYGALVQESKKYRKRAQESEAELAKMKKKAEIDRQKQMESQNQWKELAEERAMKIQELEPIVDEFKRNDAEEREKILSDFTMEDREQFGGLSTPQLRSLHSKFFNTTNSVVPTDKTPPRGLNPSSKDWTKMTQAERRTNWADIVKGYALNNKR